MPYDELDHWFDNSSECVLELNLEHSLKFLELTLYLVLGKISKYSLTLRTLIHVESTNVLD